ncbi:hypothetical protein GJ496_007724 [Pomphorhynchus laevis]|nr:hypothetical protein GJ496_007724 [Pomphorhynchus laevis]
MITVSRRIWDMLKSFFNIAGMCDVNDCPLDLFDGSKIYSMLKLVDQSCEVSSPLENDNVYLPALRLYLSSKFPNILSEERKSDTNTEDELIIAKFSLLVIVCGLKNKPNEFMHWSQEMDETCQRSLAILLDCVLNMESSNDCAYRLDRLLQEDKPNFEHLLNTNTMNSNTSFVNSSMLDSSIKNDEYSDHLLQTNQHLMNISNSLSCLPTGSIHEFCKHQIQLKNALIDKLENMLCDVTSERDMLTDDLLEFNNKEQQLEHEIELLNSKLIEHSACEEIIASLRKKLDLSNKTNLDQLQNALQKEKDSNQKRNEARLEVESLILKDERQQSEITCLKFELSSSKCRERRLTFELEAAVKKIEMLERVNRQLSEYCKTTTAIDCGNISTSEPVLNISLNENECLQNEINICELQDNLRDLYKNWIPPESYNKNLKDQNELLRSLEVMKNESILMMKEINEKEISIMKLKELLDNEKAIHLQNLSLKDKEIKDQQKQIDTLKTSIKNKEEYINALIKHKDDFEAYYQKHKITSEKTIKDLEEKLSNAHASAVVKKPVSFTVNLDDTSHKNRTANHLSTFSEPSRTMIVEKEKGKEGKLQLD